MNILAIDPGVSKTCVSILSNGELFYCDLFTEVDPHLKEFHPRMNAHMIRATLYFMGLLQQPGVDHVAWEIVPAFAKFASRDLVLATADTLKVFMAFEVPRNCQRCYKADGQGSSTKTVP